MARNTEGSSNKPKKKKKPDNQQHKTVYFNTHNINDVKLYEYAQSVGVRNFSGWVKSLIYQEMIRRNGVPPNPYEYVAVAMDTVEVPETRTVPVKVKPTKPVVEKTQSATTRDNDIKVSIGGKEIEVDPKSVVEEEPEDNVVEEEVDLQIPESEGEDQQETEEEQPQNNVRSAAAAAMANMYKRK